MIWVAGRIVADEDLMISALDRTFEHGLGLFETFRTWSGHPTLLPRHLARITRSAKELRLPLDPAALPDANAVAELLDAEGITDDVMLRLTLSGGRSETEGGVAWLRSAPLPTPTRSGGAIVGPPGRWEVDEFASGLARHKTLNYWKKRTISEWARSQGYDEYVSTTTDGVLCWEGTRTNLCAVQSGTLIAPLAGPLLPGIMRALVADRAPLLGIKVREDYLYLAEIEHADEIFLTNAVRGIIPVSQFGKWTYPAPGPLTRRLWDDILPWLHSRGTPA
ncbi:MAG: aminotransferase class IV [Isosphaeraceae bacterium]